MLSINNKNLFRKRRYKPLYKKFVNLKKNIQYRRKLFFNNFKKWKWQKFFKYLKKSNKNSKKKFIMYDHNKYGISIFLKYVFKKRFQHNLQVKKKLSLFYGNLLNKYLKKCLNLALKKKKTLLQNKNINFNFFLIKILENRLDTILYRSHFVLSIRGARQLISHGHVYVNKKLVKNKSFQLKQGDLIEINNKYHNLIIYNLNNNHFWPIPPKYLQINYKIFQIVFYNNIKFINLSTHFPFWLNLHALINYYKY